MRHGRFIVHGLSTGEPYRIELQSVGYAPQNLSGIRLTLGEQRQIDFVLVPLATDLGTVQVVGKIAASNPRSSNGAGASISDSALRRLPTLNRDLFDFIRLVPQAGTRFGLTGGGASFRFNNYVIDGVSDRQLQGNQATGGPTNGKAISMEAVKEYQVLLSPYSVRYGDFTGMTVNAVTKNGTNELHGSVFAYMRNEEMARTNSFAGSSPYRREQFGFSLGGPIIRNRLHFFIAPEFQHSTAPTPGPYLGQPSNASGPLPVSRENIERFISLLTQMGIAPGNGGPVTSLNPASTFFGRLDLSIPEWNSRAVFRTDYSSVELTRFARPEGSTSFALTSNAWTFGTAKHATAAQIFTQLTPGVFNEFLVSYLDRPQTASGYTRSPSIQTSIAAANGLPAATLVAGPPPIAGGSGAAQLLFELGDNAVFMAGSHHTLSAGMHLEIFRYHATGVRGMFGQWQFSGLDALSRGEASSYSITRDFGSAYAQVRGSRPALYVSDEWRMGDRLTVTLGVRADALDLARAPLYNAEVDSIFRRRTTDYPGFQFQWSPRVGFSWEPSADRRTRLRGGAGIFVGSFPLGWVLSPMRSTGDGIRTLSCAGSPARVPGFVADPLQQPQKCGDDRGFSDGPVALVDRNLKMAQSFRSSLALDRRLPWHLDATIEVLYSRIQHDFAFENLNLVGPQGVDRHGRVLYGTIDVLGRAAPVLKESGRFPEVIDLRNHSIGHSWAATAQLERPFSNGLELRGSYTRSRAVDFQSITSGSAVNPFDAWATARPLSGHHDEKVAGTSSYEIPHRVILGATYTMPWKRSRTDISFYYVGESGAPFTFADSSVDRRSDLNADGSGANDPIYVPTNAGDTSEIVFDDSPQAQAAAFETFINRTPCLRRQRGTIMERNSCRGPWVNTTNLSLRQSIGATGQHDLMLQLEVFNLLNLLNPSWGLFRVPNKSILQHVGQTTGTPSTPIFRFNEAAAHNSTENVESAYQLQVSMRYTF